MNDEEWSTYAKEMNADWASLAHKVNNSWTIICLMTFIVSSIIGYALGSM